MNTFVLPTIPKGRYAFIRDSIRVTVDVQDFNAIVKWGDSSATAKFNPEDGCILLGEPLDTYARNAGVWVDNIHYENDTLKICFNGRLGFEVDLISTHR